MKRAVFRGLPSFLKSLRRDSPGALPMPVIVGSPRSGTTLLRFMLDAHPSLAIPPETGFLTLGRKLGGRGDALRRTFFAAVTRHPSEAPAWDDFGIPLQQFEERLREIRPFTAREGFRAFYHMYATRLGKPRWGDKTPGYSRHLTDIERLLPEARFIHIVRDGRDASVSLRKLWFSPGHDIRVQARFWRDNVLIARRQGARCRNYREIRYEDLLVETEAVLREVCSFVELDYDESMLRYHERTQARLEEHLARRAVDGRIIVTRAERQKQQAATMLPLDRSRVGGFGSSLSSEEIREFESIAGDALRAFGYPLAWRTAAEERDGPD